MILSTKKAIVIIFLTCLSFKFVKTVEDNIKLELVDYVNGAFRNNCIKEIARYFHNCTNKLLEKFVENDSKVAVRYAFYHWVLDDFRGQENYRINYMMHIAEKLQLSDRLMEPSDYCMEEGERRRRAESSARTRYH